MACGALSIRVPARRHSCGRIPSRRGTEFRNITVVKHLCLKLGIPLEGTSFAASAGSPGILQVPSSMRQYINEKSAGRGFNLEAYEIRHETDPNRVVVDLLIGPHGAEQLQGFQ